MPKTNQHRPKQSGGSTYLNASPLIAGFLRLYAIRVLSDRGNMRHLDRTIRALTLNADRTQLTYLEVKREVIPRHQLRDQERRPELSSGDFENDQGRVDAPEHPESLHSKEADPSAVEVVHSDDSIQVAAHRMTQHGNRE
jgi:hypothetical protein